MIINIYLEKYFVNSYYSIRFSNVVRFVNICNIIYYGYCKVFKSLFFRKLISCLVWGSIDIPLLGQKKRNRKRDCHSSIHSSIN